MDKDDWTDTEEIDMRYSDGSEIFVRRYATLVPMSDEQLMDAGIIPDTRQHIKPNRRTRLKWFIGSNIAEIRLRLGSWIAGVELTNWDD